MRCSTTELSRPKETRKKLALAMGASLLSRSSSLEVAPLSTDLFDFSLPARLIAQTPAEKRDHSRLLVIHRSTRTLEHRVFSDLPEYLRRGDTLFRNNASVLPARLSATRITGGHVECMLLRPTTEDNVWWCLLRPGKKLPVGAKFFHGAEFSGTVLAKDADGTARVAFTTHQGAAITTIANRIGEVPLPPYITRTHSADERIADLSRYQTVYADRDRQVAVAAPTAGLHFTPELLRQLSEKGVGTADVTLHVGIGTFKPISTETIDSHPIHREVYELPSATQRALFPPLTGRRIAVGTTTVRSVEAFLQRHSAPLAPSRTHLDEADIYLFPPCSFRGVDALITNFHQPRSTLLCLVSSFLTPGSTDGIAWLKDIYEESIRLNYRFFSYGDAMLIL